MNREVARILSSPGDDVSSRDIRDRCLLLLVNEAMYALSDKVVASADELDLAMVLGVGFPPFRGGLLRWADTRGARDIRDNLVGLAEKHGPRFAPAPSLVDLAASGRSFTSF